MSDLAWLDGALVPRGDARIPIDDRGFLYGAACFETMRAYGGVVFRLDRHLDRLDRGLRGLGVDPPRPEALASAIEETLTANKLADARIRLTVSAGAASGRPGLDAARPAVLVVAEPVAPAADAVRALIARSVRVDTHRPLPFAKTANYLTSLLALEEARRAGYDQALLLGPGGDIVEAATANVFAVCDGVLVTPPLDAGPLPGVTREAVLECAAALRLPHEERPLPLPELVESSELLLTNSVVEVQPVSDLRHAGVVWTYEAPGPVCSALAAALGDLVRRECATKAAEAVSDS